MQHIDVELLAMLALGAEEPDEGVATHLASCAECQAELRALQRVVAAGNRAPREADLAAPPARVWDGITDAVGTSSLPPPTPLAPTERQPEFGLDQEIPVRPTPRSRRTPTWLAVAAGLVVGALGAGTLVAVLDSDDAEPAPSRVVADAELDPLGETGTAGRAEVLEMGGTRLLEVQIDDVPPGGDFREVWLLDAEAQRLVSLGVLTGTEASLVIPDGLDLAEFPVVDVSREPLDGDPAHSADSIARGTLEL